MQTTASMPTYLHTIVQMPVDVPDAITVYTTCNNELAKRTVSSLSPLQPQFSNHGDSTSYAASEHTAAPARAGISNQRSFANDPFLAEGVDDLSLAPFYQTSYAAARYAATLAIYRELSTGRPSLYICFVQHCLLYPREPALATHGQSLI